MTSFTSTLKSGREALQEFLAWWGAELAGMVPGRLRRLLSREPQWLFLDIGDDAVRIVDAAGTLMWRGASSGEPPEVLLAPKRDAASRMKIAVRMAPHDALVRRLELPAAAAANVRQVLAFELDRQTPFTEDQVYFDSVIVGRDAARQRVHVELGLAERRVVDAVLALGRAWGLRFDWIAPAGAPRVNLLRGLGDGAEDGRRVRLLPILALVAVTLLAVWLGLRLNRLDDAVAAADAQLAKLRAEALLVEKLMRDAATIELQAGFLGRSSSIPKLRVLHEVTRLLPDDVWLHQFQVIEREIRIAGYAPNAATLVSALGSSPLFQNVRFRAPITKTTPGGLDRFELSVDLRPETSS
jgi:general secretion pathway protein L